MSWAIGYDTYYERDIGYGVPAYCDYPDCKRKIDRGLAYVCCNQQPYGGDEGCGLYFCSQHTNRLGQCDRCVRTLEHYTPSEDHPEWVEHKLIHESWQEWRDCNPERVEEMQRG